MNFDKIKLQAFINELEKMAAAQAPARIFASAYKPAAAGVASDLARHTRIFGNAGKRITPKLPRQSSTTSSASSLSSKSSSSSSSYMGRRAL